MTRYRLTCADCGSSEHEVSRSDAKYCPSCKLLRALLHASKKYRWPRKCRACDTPFLPLNPRDQSHCGTCSSTYATTPAGHCLLCRDRSAPLHHASVAVCVRCVKDPEQRSSIVRALREGKRVRRKTNEGRSHAVERIA